jgi:hypothetical protein
MPWESDVVDEDTADFEDLKLAHGSEMGIPTRRDKRQNQDQASQSSVTLDPDSDACRGVTELCDS